MQRSSSVATNEAVEALMLASRAFVALAARSLANLNADVTLPQFRALVVLASRGPQRIADIATELQVSPSTATRMCDRLVRKGLARRVRSSSDRRVVRLKLTATGQRLVEQVSLRRRKDLARIVSATADQWQPVVTQALRAFAATAGEIPEHEWWLGWATQDDTEEDAS